MTDADTTPVQEDKQLGPVTGTIDIIEMCTSLLAMSQSGVYSRFLIIGISDDVNECAVETFPSQNNRVALAALLMAVGADFLAAQPETTDEQMKPLAEAFNAEWIDELLESTEGRYPEFAGFRLNTADPDFIRTMYRPPTS